MASLLVLDLGSLHDNHLIKKGQMAYVQSKFHMYKVKVWLSTMQSLKSLYNSWDASITKPL